MKTNKISAFCQRAVRPFLKKKCRDEENEYRCIAESFIADYPLTSFLGDAIDTDSVLLREGTSVNVIIAGFGAAGHEIFLASAANNQLMMSDGVKVRLAPVRYHIFDENASESSLADTYCRYKHNAENSGKEKYLPYPDIPSEERFYGISARKPEFCKTVRDICSDKASYNFLVAACDSESANKEIAQSVLRMCGENSIDNLTVFAIVDGDSCDGCIFLKKKSSVREKLHTMATEREGIYEDGNGGRKRAQKKTHLAEKHGVGFESSFYGCLSLRFKFNLMGLDFLPSGSSEEGISYSEYMDIYNGRITENPEKYGVFPGFNVTSRRDVFAIHEHHRWNAFMLTRGFVPSSIEQILSERESRDADSGVTNGKSYKERRHGNLTTFEGLVTYRRMIAERDGVSEDERDVIKYDYQLLDKAYELLTSAGFKVVRLL